MLLRPEKAILNVQVVVLCASNDMKRPLDGQNNRSDNCSAHLFCLIGDVHSEGPSRRQETASDGQQAEESLTTDEEVRYGFRGKEQFWILDSGATRSVANVAENFCFLNQDVPFANIETATSPLRIQGIGDFLLGFTNSQGQFSTTYLEGIKYVPSCPLNVLSLQHLGRAGFAGTWDASAIIVRDHNSGREVVVARWNGACYTLIAESADRIVNNADSVG